jgi:hypothetical protein
MEWMSVLVPVASLIAGWFLNEMSKKSQMSRERRALIGRALSNLLELHHQIRAVENTLQLLMSRFGLTAEDQATMRQLLQRIIPQSDKYVVGYEDAIGQLSESNPVTAFRLSSNAQIPRFLDSMRTIPALDGMADTDMALFEKQLKEILVPHLGQAIKELAKLHGRSTLRQVNKMLDAPAEIPEELNQFLQKLQEENQKQLAGTDPEGKS